MSEEQARINPQPEDETWSLLEVHYKNGRPLVGRIVELVGDHLIVDINGIQGTIEDATLGITWSVAELTDDEQQLPEETLVSRRLDALKGQEILVRVLQADRDLHILTLSQQLVSNPDDIPEHYSWRQQLQDQMQQRRQLLNQLRPGDICSAKVISIYGHQINVNVNGVSGIVPPQHVSEQQRLIDPWRIVQPGQMIEVMVLDKDNDCLTLSLIYARQLDEVLGSLKPGDTHQARISSLTNEGIYVDLGGALALIPVDQVVSGYITHPADLYHREQTLVVKIQEITADRRVMASLSNVDS
ncbi:S1 RNA-binding domain-containing protein [Dictyobacter aurantiacus]|uniref:S1 motif domain-containing protein n=1 Tax=Dictyobacter aurantiacus TaxID=1936993 RepID=A0A401ZMW9_9CHLR|nr:S1 RNA-binding domain-containing protein [Dictyobacter aurantiacus]GCE08106.1 hypothetical protein KDAU_54350 [Dictyobacter aurantiacus]